MVGAIAILVTIGLVIVALAIFAWRHARTRERQTDQSLRDLAQQRGLVYEHKADDDFRKAWSVLPELPNTGAVHHLLYGDVDGLPVTLFRHRYVVNTGQATAVILHWVVSTDVPDWPELHLKRRSALARAFGARSRVCEDPEFDKRWVIKAKNPALARDLLRPQVLPLLDFEDGASQHPPTLRKSLRGWHIVHGKLCAVFRGKFDADSIPPAISRVGAVRAAIAGELESATD